MLEDDESKDIFLHRVCYSISSDFRFMKYIIDKYTFSSDTISGEQWLATLPSEKSIILYGAGIDALISLPYFKKDPKFAGLCD